MFRDSITVVSLFLFFSKENTENQSKDLSFLPEISKHDKVHFLKDIGNNLGKIFILIATNKDVSTRIKKEPQITYQHISYLGLCFLSANVLKYADAFSVLGLTSLNISICCLIQTLQTDQAVCCVSFLTLCVNLPKYTFGTNHKLLLTSRKLQLHTAKSIFQNKSYRGVCFSVIKTFAFVICFLAFSNLFQCNKDFSLQIKYLNVSNNHRTVTKYDAKFDKNEHIDNDENILKNFMKNQHFINYIPTQDYLKRHYMTFPISSGKRLASFRPLLNSELPDFVSFTKLSSGGFFYPGNGLYVKCIGCDNLVEINRFENEPSSETYHKPACRFIQTESRENSHDISVRPPSTQDVSASSSHRTDSLYQSTDRSPVNSDQLDQVPLTASQISNEPPSHLPRPPTNSVYPVYSDAVKRLQSFATWPANHFLSISVLVNAGFFFAGYSDCVRCYSCGLGLRSWKPGDDVDVEHKRFRPSCSLLQLKQRNNVASNVASNVAINIASNVASNDPSVSARPLANGDAPTPDPAIRDSISITTTEEQVPAQNVTSPLSIIHDLPPAPVRNGQPVASASQASSVQRDMRSVTDVSRKLLQRENETLKQQMKCKSCQTADVQDLFVPCGHMSTCKQCSNKFSQCPACGKRILGTVNVYFA